MRKRMLVNVSWIVIVHLLIGSARVVQAEAPKPSKKNGASLPVSKEPNKPRPPVPHNEPLRISLVVRDSPYNRGAEECVLEGGTANTQPLTIAILAPQHTPVVQVSPALYWYVSENSRCPVGVTLINEQTNQVILDVTIPPPVAPGVHYLRLSDYQVQLVPGLKYAWSVALVHEQKEGNLVASVDIERSEMPADLRVKLTEANTKNVPALYEEAGFSYEALAALFDLTTQSPKDEQLRGQRAALLEKIGIKEVNHQP